MPVPVGPSRTRSIQYIAPTTSGDRPRVDLVVDPRVGGVEGQDGAARGEREKSAIEHGLAAG